MTIFVGEISSASVDAAIRSLDRTEDKTLVITSAGGDPSAAIRLADALRQRGSTLEVARYCISVCAQFVAMGAPSVSVRPGSIVAFHNSAVAGSLLAQMDPRSIPPAVVAQAAAEKEVYARWGIDPDALIDQFTGLQPYCTYGGGDRRRGYKSGAQFWTPPRAWMTKHHPGRVTGWWPSSQIETERAAAEVRDDLPALQGFRFGPAKPWSDMGRRLIATACQ
ncbi:MAG: hypothetical protein EON90_11455 [Brevundimonas sp.]|nr:MAG: hypothetical protein EON90_11455 [Brevundimonas sp.]